MPSGLFKMKSGGNVAAANGLPEVRRLLMIALVHLELAVQAITAILRSRG
jgi:hypothetical protein